MIQERRGRAVNDGRAPDGEEKIIDLVCLSHLRWDFVYQRPQHLLSRFARDRRVLYVEEPVFGEESAPRMEVGGRPDGVLVATPRLPERLSERSAVEAQKILLDRLLKEKGIRSYALWYYTPMALAFTRHLRPQAVVYDCMDELSAFKGAHPRLAEYEAALLKRANLVFTGGMSLYESKRHLHPNIFPFPSSIDKAHFMQARSIAQDPPDQAHIPRPRLGFFGVIDERMDLRLLDRVAALRPDWQLVLCGPVVKIDPASLPRRTNLHYLGMRSYRELPAYISGWSVALLPFARNKSTRFISPTKTPEYLAAGRPVVSTSIRDVVRPYGQLDLVRIADRPEDFVAAAEAAMAGGPENEERARRADGFLASMSWDSTWEKMDRLLQTAVRAHGNLLRRRLSLETTYHLQYERRRLGRILDGTAAKWRGARDRRRKEAAA